MAEHGAGRLSGCRRQLLVLVILGVVLGALLGGAFCGFDPTDPDDPEVPVLMNHNGPGVRIPAAT